MNAETSKEEDRWVNYVRVSLSTLYRYFFQISYDISTDPSDSNELDSEYLSSDDASKGGT